MHRILSSRALLAEIDRVLSAKRAHWGQSPLDELVAILCDGRGYESIAIFLAIPGRSDEPSRRTAQLLVPIRMGRRLLGVIEVNGVRAPHADELLLKQVATRLARFLTGNGKWLARRVRELKSPGARSAMAAGSA